MGFEEIGVKLVADGQAAFDNALSSANKSVDKFGDATEKNAGHVATLGKETTKLKISLTDLNSGLEIAKKAAGMMGDAYQALIGDLLKYSDQVRDLSRISGASTEESSRLIQVADDLQIEYSSLTAAAKALANDGIALTTEELAKSSDEYLKLTTAGERLEYSTKKFGRAGIELTKILEQGGDALREMAAGQAENLVLTEKQVQAARDLEKAQDELEDSIQGVKFALANELVPWLNEAFNAGKKLANWGEDMNAVLEDHSKQLIKSGMSYAEYTREMVRARLVAAGFAGTTEEVSYALEKLKGNLGLGALYYRDISDEGTRAAAAAVGFARDTTAAAKAAEGANLSYQALRAELGNTTLSIEDQERALASDTLTMTAAQTATTLTGQAIANLTANYGSLNNAQLYNILVQGMDKDAAIALGVAMGILSPQVMAARDAAESLNKKFQQGTIDAQTYAGQAEALAAAIAKLQDKSITITTYYNNQGQRSDNLENPNNPNGPGQTGTAPNGNSGTGSRNLAPDRTEKKTKLAEGGSFRIPMGFGYEGFDLGGMATASGGETVTVTPKSVVSAGPTTYHYDYSTSYNLNLSTQQSSASVQQSFALMRLLAG